MALKSTLLNYVKGSYTDIVDERYRLNLSAGSDTFILGDVKRAFLETDFSIEEGDSNGTVLTLNVDYEFTEKDSYYTGEEGKNCWTKIKILNAAYYTSVVYITYRALHSYTDADYFNTLRSDVDTNSADIADIQSNPVLPTGYIEGLEISNDTDTDHDINIEAGRCKDSTGAVDLVLSSEITKQIDAAWSAGDDAGGLDTGSVAADTWYYIYLIRKDSDGSIDALFSASATSPTMPSGYTYKRRIRGAVLTDGSANIIGFYQKDNYFIYNSLIFDLVATTVSTSKTNINVSTPDSLTVLGLFGFHLRDSGTAIYVNFYGKNQPDRAVTQDVADFLSGTSNQAVYEFSRVAENGIISYKSDNTSPQNFSLRTLGFIDNAQD